MRKLIKNSIRTPDGTVLTSRHVHEYKCYKDKNGEIYMNDGGTSYIRRSINEVPYEDLSVYSDDPFEIVRNSVVWGTYGKNGNEPLKYKTISELSSSHINNILLEPKLIGELKDILKKEILYRNECETKGLVETVWRED